MKRYILLLGITMLLFSALFSQENELVEYKRVNELSLKLEVIYPEIKRDTLYPGLIFFFGGGWSGGTRDHFRDQAEYFASRGLVCFLADYRVRKRNGSTPMESLQDAKSAMRYLRAHAEDFGVDPDRIIAAGGSAGGHLAAATALIEAFNEDTDDLGVSCIPNALVLFNPVIDNGPGGYGFERVGERYKDFSPLHNIREGAPPTIIVLGTQDRLIPVTTMEYYQLVMQKVGSRCEVHFYEGAKHGFFNKKTSEKYYYETVKEADLFLASLGYLKGEPTLSLQLEKDK